VGGAAAHVGEVLALADVYIQVALAGVETNYHPAVDLDLWAEEEPPARLSVVEAEGGGEAGFGGDERAAARPLDRARVGAVAGVQRVHHGGAARFGEQVGAEADQAPGGHQELQVDAAVLLVDHVLQ